MVGCGSDPILLPGTYDVGITVTQDYIDPNIGEVYNTEWKFGFDKDKYSVDALGKDHDRMKGREEDGSVVFHYSQPDFNDVLGDCEESNTIDVLLNPASNRKAFSGTWYQVTRLCFRGNVIDDVCYSCGDLIVGADLEGKKQ